jgi:hypothetical protein
MSTGAANAPKSRVPSRMLRSEPQSRQSYVPSQRLQERRKSTVSNKLGPGTLSRLSEVSTDLLNGNIGPVGIRDVIVKIVVTKDTMRRVILRFFRQNVVSYSL